MQANISPKSLHTCGLLYLVLVNRVTLLLMLQCGAKLGLAFIDSGHQVMTAENIKILQMTTCRFSRTFRINGSL